MKLSHMDADLSKITDPEQMTRRLSYWETRWKLMRGQTPVDVTNYNAVAKRHAERVAKVVRIG